MTKPVRVKNGETMTNVAAAAVQEVKAVADTVLNTVNSVNEDAKRVMVAQQEILQSSLEIWQAYNQFYFDFVIGAIKQTLEQSLVLREQMSVVVEDNLKKAQALTIAEEEFVFETAETWQARMRSASEHVTNLFAPVSLN